MLNFRKLLLTTFLGGILNFNVNAQADQVISGGNSVSSMVCNDGRVYTWGRNINTFGTGLLGNAANTATIVNTPTAVAIPENVTIQQIIPIIIIK